MHNLGVDALTDVVILCGGRGTRLQERTQSIPKPLVEIGGEPILSHVIRIYAAQGLSRFLLCTGYKGELIEEALSSRSWPDGIELRCVETGLETPTGGRIARVGPLLEGRPFCATYADGVADIDLRALVAHHRGSGALATMTVVQPELPFGVAMVADGRVTGFREKPVTDQWVNGGFFVMEPGALGYLDGDSVLEREPLERLAADGALAAYRHTGFWRCLDTAKDAQALEDAGSSRWLA
jgi:glucose-1-phosphate cytidylyltransferase